MLLCARINLVSILYKTTSINTTIRLKGFISTLTETKITEILRKNETSIAKECLPPNIERIECNQLASNNPIEDRLRVSSLILPGFTEPTLILGVFDGHGGGTTADLISRRLFNYIALSLYPELDRPKISNYRQLKEILVDLHISPTPHEGPNLAATELNSLTHHCEHLADLGTEGIAAKLKKSFKRCDEDLSREIQYHLTNPQSSPNTLHYYLSAAVSGCCAIVMVIHQGMGYLASTGDCRAVLGVFDSGYGSDKSVDQSQGNNNISSGSVKFNAFELNDEHNCDNINEIKRLAASHPISEQNTMIKHNRLLGHLMPFRAFGDFNYKWPADLIKACSITRAFGSGVIPANYNTPPYLTAEPDVTEVPIGVNNSCDKQSQNPRRHLVIATDGLWELFESSRDVVETVINHTLTTSQETAFGIYDGNCATHLLRSALCSGSHQDCGKDIEELKRLYHVRLESTLTLPQSVVRNFRDDISIILLNLS